MISNFQLFRGHFVKIDQLSVIQVTISLLMSFHNKRK